MTAGFLSITEAIDFLYSLQYNRWKLDLSRITKIVQFLDNPQTKYRSIHIAGTNGKGSTAAILESILRQAGYRTGLYTSPHLRHVSERIQIAGMRIPDQDLMRLTEMLKAQVIQLDCTFFETLTAIAFQYFAEQKVDIAIFETGLGGRLDATNVVVPVLSIITAIDFDHCDHLGDTLEKIAIEKAGIIKQNGICLTARQKPGVVPTLAQVCQEKHARLFRAEKMIQFWGDNARSGKTTAFFAGTMGEQLELEISLAGVHQLDNSATALAAIEILTKNGFCVSRDDIVNGLKTVYWPGRFQKVFTEPDIILDVAHNYGSMTGLVDTLQKVYPNRLFLFIVGMLKDKPCAEMIKLLLSVAKDFVAVTPANVRALAAEDLANIIKKYTNNVVTASSMVVGLEYARRHTCKEDIICITGSHYTVSTFLELEATIT